MTESPAAAPGYGDYPGIAPADDPGRSGRRSGAHAAQSNGHGSYLPPGPPSDAGSAARNGYWPEQAPPPAGLPDAPAPGYLDQDPGQLPDPLGAGGQQSGYHNGYRPQDPAGYPPQGYPHDPGGYAPLDPYGRDGYGGYPGYGTSGR